MRDAKLAYVDENNGNTERHMVRIVVYSIVIQSLTRRTVQRRLATESLRRWRELELRLTKAGINRDST